MVGSLLAGLLMRQSLVTACGFAETPEIVVAYMTPTFHSHFKEEQRIWFRTHLSSLRSTVPPRYKHYTLHLYADVDRESM